MGACFNLFSPIALPKPPSRKPSSLPSSHILKASSELTIEDFIIERAIGKGTHGKVYLVIKEDTNETFAMKSVSLATSDPESIVRNIEELSGLWRECPFIVPIRYVITDADKLYILTDYTTGGQLFRQIRKVSQISEDCARVYLAELLVALEFLHSRNFVVGDLKPNKLLLDLEGHLQLSSFGMLKKGGSFKTKSEDDSRSEYTAPESLNNTASGDIWSWGVIMYEMLAGNTPHAKGYNAKLDMKPHFSAEACSIIKKALSLDTNDRISCASEAKSQHFFGGVNWAEVELKKLNPLLKPSAISGSFIERTQTSRSLLENRVQIINC